MLQNQESYEKTSAEIQYTALKTIFSFSRRPEKMVFPKKIALEYDISCVIEKDDFSFSRKYDLTPKRKMKDDLSQKIQGNMIFTSNVQKRWSFQKEPRRYMIFLVLSGKVVFFPNNMTFFSWTENETRSFSRNTRKDDIFCVHVQVLQTWRDTPLAKKIKDDLIPQKYT